MNTISMGHELNRIIGVARDGHRVYAKAAADMQNKDPQLSAIMMRMADANVRIIDQLTRRVRQGGERPNRHGTALGHLRGYVGWLGTVLGDAGIQHVSEGHASEARLIRLLDAASADARLPGDIRGLLDALLRDARRHHDQLHVILRELRSCPN
jgi:uncharacterized protein (TIGR02284 family)